MKPAESSRLGGRDSAVAKLTMAKKIIKKEIKRGGGLEKFSNFVIFQTSRGKVNIGLSLIKKTTITNYFDDVM